MGDHWRDAPEWGAIVRLDDLINERREFLGGLVREGNTARRGLRYSYADLAERAGNVPDTATFQRWGAGRVTDFPKLVSLRGAARAIEVSEWQVGISLLESLGLEGQPDDRVMQMVGILPTGWVDLDQRRMSTWIAVGSTAVAEQQTERLRRENEELKARIAELETRRSHR